MKQQELEQMVLTLQQRVIALEAKQKNESEFRTDFSGKIIFNKEVQFLRKVTRKDGSTVITINP